jgi:hypothetical protein
MQFDGLVKHPHNVIPKQSIQKALDDYNNQEKLWPDTMAIAFPTIDLQRYTDLASSVAGVQLEYTNGNYYSHTQPYLPHTDWFKHLDNVINMVIPLEVDCELAHMPSLVIFDQVWPYNSVTWCMHGKVNAYEPNTGVKGWPGEYPVTNKTGRALDPNFWYHHLSHYPHECFYNMSGRAYPFEVGSAIIFGNRNVHCTSYYKGRKTGLSLRFKVKG